MQLVFSGGDKHRDYSIGYRAPRGDGHGKVAGRWYAATWACCFAGREPGEATIGWGNLAEADAVANAEEYLKRLPQASLEHVFELGEPLP